MPNLSSDFWQLAAARKRFYSRKLCLAEEPGDPCNSPIAQAHTVPRSQLKNIAEDGHVYSFDVSMGQLAKTNGKIAVKKVGIGNFSTLNCFCARHDNLIFADVEDVPLVFTPRQLALLNYRTIDSELYRKLSSNMGTEHHIDHMKRRKGVRDADGEELLRAFSAGEALGLRDGRTAFQRSGDSLANQDYSQLSALIIRFKKLPSVMAVGGFYPEFDYNAQRRQRLGDAAIIYQAVSFNILASEGRAAIAIIWEKGHDHCKDFATSLT
jgi:hypothetical protein